MSQGTYLTAQGCKYIVFICDKFNKENKSDRIKQPTAQDNLSHRVCMCVCSREPLKIKQNKNEIYYNFKFNHKLVIEI